MSYTILPHVTTGDLATAALHNSLLDDIAILKTSITDIGDINAPNAILSAANGNRLGPATPTGVTASPTRTNTGILLYNFSSTSWAGLGADSVTGDLYVVTGISAPSTRFVITAGGSGQLSGILQIGSIAGLSASFPAWRNTGAVMEAVLGNQSNYADIRGSRFFAMAAGSSFADLTVPGNAIVGNAIVNANLTVSTSAYISGCTPLMQGYQEKFQTVAAASTTVIDLSAGNHVILTLGTSISAITLSSSLFGLLGGYVQPLVLHIQHDGTLRTITWTINGIAVRWSSGVAPTLGSTNGSITRVVIYYMAGYAVFGEQIGYAA